MIRQLAFVSVFLILLLSISPPSFCQGPSSRWYFSNGAGLTISTTTAVPATGGQNTYTSNGCASIADASGNLLFYTDGATVWNQLHNAMPNGTGLFGNNSIQSAVILKKPGSTSLYYIFTAEVGGANQGMRYTLVDISLSGGTGSVTAKNVSLYPFAIYSNLAATRHCNGTDYWIVGSGGTGVVSFSLTAAGVSPVNLSTSGVLNARAIKISPNGTRLAAVTNFTSFQAPTNRHVISLYEFNTTTGYCANTPTTVAYIPSNSFFLWPVVPLHSCEFSPNGRFLYSVYGNTLQQFDLLGPLNYSFPDPLLTANTNTFEASTISGLQLAPNGKIYVQKPGQSVLGVINSPDLLGTACNYNTVGASIGTATSGLSLPNLVNSDFENRSKVITYSSTINACQTLTFYPPYKNQVPGYVISSSNWNFGDINSTANTSTLNSPVHAYSAPGNYSVTLIIAYGCNKTDTVVQVINVISPSLVLTGPSASCGPLSTSVTVNGGSGNYT